jgi:hypothetical protein
VTLDAAGPTTTVSFLPPVVDDQLEQPHRSVFLALHPTAGCSGPDATATGTVLDDDMVVTDTIWVPTTSVQEGDSGSGNQVRFTFIQDHPNPPGSITEYLLGAGGTATGREDYEGWLQDRFITAPYGTTAFDLLVDVIGDATPEPDETIALSARSMWSSGNVLVGGVATILNDDEATPDPVPPALAIGDASAAEGDRGTTAMQFPLTRRGDLRNAASIRVTAAGAAPFGSPHHSPATLGSDVTFTDTTVRFAPGQATATVTAHIAGDTVPEPTESFTLTLLDPVDVVVDDSTAHGVIVDDDPVLYRADTTFRPTGAVRWSGAGIRNTTGAGQTMGLMMRRGTSRVIEVRASNRGNVVDTYTLGASSTGQGLSFAAYYGASNVTAALRRGSQSTGSLSVDASWTYRIVLKVPRAARRGSRTTLVLRQSSSAPSHPSATDTIRMRVHVR